MQMDSTSPRDISWLSWWRRKGISDYWRLVAKVNRRVLDPFLKQWDFLHDILLTSAFFGLNIKPQYPLLPSVSLHACLLKILFGHRESQTKWSLHSADV